MNAADRAGIDLAEYCNPFPLRQRLKRLLWNVVWLVLCRYSPTPLHGWRRFWLRAFGAKVGRGAHPYPRAKIWAPWNLEMGEHSCLANDVDCYSVDRIVLGDHAIVSQYGFLCTASHDPDDPSFCLVTAPIAVAAQAWIAADAFIGPGVTVGVGAVVGARATVFKDVPAWTIVVGNPAKVLRQRRIVKTRAGSAP